MQRLTSVPESLNIERLEPTSHRFDRSSRLVLWLSIGLLLVSIAQKAYRFTLPTDGFSAQTEETSNAPIFQENLLGSPSPLQTGDKFIAVNGVSYDMRVQSSMLLRPEIRALKAGDTAQYTVLRDGQQVRLEVPLYHWTFQGIATAFLEKIQQGLLNNYASWFGLLLVSFVFWQRPRNITAQLMLLFYTVEVSIFISRLASSVSVADLVNPLAYWLSLTLGHVSYSIFEAPILLHLCLTFPRPKSFLQDRSWLIVGLYLLPWLLFFLDVALNIGGLSFMLVGVYAVLGALALTHTFVTVKDPASQARLRWFAFGFSVPCLFGLLYVLNKFGFIPQDVNRVAAAFPSGLVLAVCLAVAVLGYRLFDIDIIALLT